MTLDHHRIILITGIMAAGKSTVAQSVAKRLPKSVHLRGDAFRRMIINGRAKMSLEPSSEAYEQLLLRYRIAAAAADLYLKAGFTVVYQDIILGPELEVVAKWYQPYPLHVIVLCPSPNIATDRDKRRSKTGYGHTSAAGFDDILRTETPRIGLWVDNSQLTIVETVDFILNHLDEARVAIS